MCINYVGDASCDRTDVAEKGPRMCGGVKIPSVKRGKFICKALKKNKAKEGNSKGSKKKKCKFVCDEGWSVKWTKRKI